MHSTSRDAVLEDLLDKLYQGDDKAAEKVFVIYEPYLRMVVRFQFSDKLRSKLDSSDIIQSVWADLLTRFREAGCRFVNPDHLRAFLMKSVRNRLIDRVRQHEKALQCERPLARTLPAELPPSHEPRPSEVAQANELWAKMLALCNPAQREVVQLKRQGYSPAEIASRTGYSEGSVYRILSDLSWRLASAKLPTQSGSDGEGRKPPG